MIHNIIDKLSKQQSITILNWVNKKLNNDNNHFDFIIENEDAFDYIKILLHLLIENDESDSLQLKKQLIKNAQYFEKEREVEQKKKGDFIDVLSLVISVFAWLNIKPVSEKEEKDLIEKDLKIKVSEKQFKKMKKNGLILNSHLVIRDKKGLLKKVKLSIE
ncbi:hypothetical protein [Flavobacterium sp.]|uniref:hypothetical protein n=1 Tax=Flavobacterium sp. TaxID=239 RepID=UPI003F69C64A